MMPRNIRRFAWLWILSAVMGFAGIALAPPEPAFTKLGATPSMQMGMMAVGGTIIFLILLPFFWLTVWRRKNWARWVSLVLFVISLPALFIDPNWFQADHLPSNVLACGLTLMESLAFVFVFTGDARPWFKSETQTDSLPSDALP
ncbi:MAG: hypothetical protein ACLP8A_14190 [Methylovirgula sp.]